MSSLQTATGVQISKFVDIFSNLSREARKCAIQKLVSTLDSDEMDMVIEAIDTKIDDVAGQCDARHTSLESESLEDSGVSSISPSETNYEQDDRTGPGDMDTMFYPSVEIEEGGQSLQQSPMYQCPFTSCEFETSFTSYLKTHIKNIHGDKKFKCNQCDFRANKKGNLLKHVSEVHGVDRYPCPKCDYKATQKANLQRHIDSVHEGIRYNCDYCSYTATRKDHLSRHVKQSHSNAIR